MNIVQNRKIFYIISSTLIVLSIIALIVFGLRWSIEFTGGSVFGVTFQQTPQRAVPTLSQVTQALNQNSTLPRDLIVQKVGSDRFLIKAREISEKDRQEILSVFSQIGKVDPTSQSFRSIGPVIGKELTQKTKVVFVLAILSIIFYVAFAFRQVSRPVPSFLYGLAGLLALFHDVLIPLGALAFLGRYFGVEISIPIITAFLTIFGYSINDTVVVFDRLRENLLQIRGHSFSDIADGAIKQSMRRSLYTSATTLVVLIGLFFLGGETLRWFSFTLIIGIISGTYSSLFLAVPLLTSYQVLKTKRA